MRHQSHFILNVLGDLQTRTDAAARKYPGLLHMLVLPPGESIRVDARTGVRPLGFRTRKQKLAMRKFGDTKLVGPLPPRTSWPKGIEPLRAIVAEQECHPCRPNEQEPYRIHLFFGGSPGAFDRLQALADDLDGIRRDVDRAIFGSESPLPESVFFTASDCLHGARRARLDSWLCTVHWWAWVWTECPFRTRPHVVYAGKTYQTDPRDNVVGTKLAFSMFDADVLTASAITLSLIRRFFDEPPVLLADYPHVPKADEMEPAEVAMLSERSFGR